MYEEILPAGAGEFAVALGYPNTRTVAAGNLGFQILTRALAGIPRLRLERFYLPDTGAPRLATDQAGPGPARLLASSDLVLLSVSFEGDAPAVPFLLQAGGLPAFAAQRRSGHPLVIGGGAAVMINPEPLAAFFDLFLIGEAEAIVFQLVAMLGQMRRAPRPEVVAALDEGLPGALAPGRRLHRIWTAGPAGLDADRLAECPAGAAGLEPRDSEAHASSAPVAPDRHVRRVVWDAFGREGSGVRVAPEAGIGQSYLLELARGCHRRCRFCAAARIYAPLRECPAEVLLARGRAEIERGETVGLLSLSAGDYRDLECLTNGLAELDLRLSLSSLPASFMRPAVAARLVAGGTRTATLAPETGTERLRALAGKPMGDEAILRAAAMLADAGLERLRTYFIIGLPFEEDTDVAGIGALLGRLRERLAGRCELAATVNAFVPKPRTPFQWAPMAPLGLLRARAGLLRRSAPRGVRLRIKSFREARLQALLTRGDVTWGPLLARMAAERVGVREALRRHEPTTDALLGPVRVGAGLPWDSLLDSEERALLAREWLSLAGGPG